MGRKTQKRKVMKYVILLICVFAQSNDVFLGMKSIEKAEHYRAVGNEYSAAKEDAKVRQYYRDSLYKGHPFTNDYRKVKEHARKSGNNY